MCFHSYTMRYGYVPFRVRQKLPGTSWLATLGRTQGVWVAHGRRFSLPSVPLSLSFPLSLMLILSLLLPRSLSLFLPLHLHLRIFLFSIDLCSCAFPLLFFWPRISFRLSRIPDQHPLLPTIYSKGFPGKGDGVAGQYDRPMGQAALYGDIPRSSDHLMGGLLPLLPG